MLRLTLPFVFALAAASFFSSGRAAHDIVTSALPAPRLELVVIEAPGCIYCSLFRRTVLPTYEASPRAREIPIRFVDIEAATASKLALRAPIDVVPTVVLLKDNTEVGRIPGYVGPEIFFHSINYLISHQD